MNKNQKNHFKSVFCIKITPLQVYTSKGLIGFVAVGEGLEIFY